VRQEIRRIVEQIEPFDEIEASHQQSTLDWIDLGAELFRTAKPATPPKHLVSYFPVIDQTHILLVEHRNAGLWLPPGGHVDPNKHPRDTVIREAQEELEFDVTILCEDPVFITSTVTVGSTAGHTDISLWYPLQGDRSAPLRFDDGEFESIRWFGYDEIPYHISDPHLKRFMEKLSDA
jgi:8-oxo-dGTP diphosphatase